MLLMAGGTNAEIFLVAHCSQTEALFFSLFFSPSFDVVHQPAEPFC